MSISPEGSKIAVAGAGYMGEETSMEDIKMCEALMKAFLLNENDGEQYG